MWKNNLIDTSKLHIVLFSFLAIFLFTYVDTDGYEGDDLNSVVPAIHLDEMRAGLIEGYKYDWQPLSYQTIHFIYDFVKTSDAMFMVAPLSILLSLILLFLIIREKYSTNIWSFIFLLLLFPEFIYTGLYYNSHAPACLMYVIAIWFLFRQSMHIKLSTQAIFIGFFASLAILFRFDYILGFPILLILFYLNGASKKHCVILLCVTFVVCMLALLIDLFSISELINIYKTSSAEITARADEPGWNAYTKLMALTTIMSPVAWTLLIIGCIYPMKQIRQGKLLQLTLITIAIIPLLYPLKSLLSPKYALPILTWVLIYFAYLLKELGSSVPTHVYSLLKKGFFLASLAFLVISIDIDNREPYISADFEPRRVIGTHDGSRTWGGYIKQFMKLSLDNHQKQGYLKAKQLVAQIKSTENKTWLILGKQNIFDRSSMGWRYLMLFMADSPNNVNKVISKNHIQIINDSNTIHLCEDISCINGGIADGVTLEIVRPDYVNL